jgi:3-isopropylmalate/(R)-2-methylmalate dehydratase small subunit
VEKIINGKVFVLGENIDTDQIIPANHLVYKLDDPEESKLYGKYALCGVPDGQSGLPAGDIRFVEEGSVTSVFSIIIGDNNFGCGSSREHAPFALEKAGVKAVIAPSYARIFFRNSVDGGFFIPFEVNESLTSFFKTGQMAEINTQNNTIKNMDTGESYALNPLGDIQEILEAGDIFAYAKKVGMA